MTIIPFPTRPGFSGLPKEPVDTGRHASLRAAALYYHNRLAAYRTAKGLTAAIPRPKK